jgi:hypothetical protein|tara:strand:- start:1 stop:150 length:150 start_codon:yes stop_codon:yes gene_type:complete
VAIAVELAIATALAGVLIFWGAYWAGTALLLTSPFLLVWFIIQQGSIFI